MHRHVIINLFGQKTRLNVLANAFKDVEELPRRLAANAGGVRKSPNQGNGWFSTFVLLVDCHVALSVVRCVTAAPSASSQEVQHISLL